MKRKRNTDEIRRELELLCPYAADPNYGDRDFQRRIHRHIRRLASRLRAAEDRA